MPATKTFHELEVWKRAHEFTLSAYQLSQSFPPEETYGLTLQFRRAAVSIPANIAEGYAKRGIADKARFFNIAQGSLAECAYYLILVNDLGYADPKNLPDDLRTIGKMLNAYIAKIRSGS